MVYILQLNRLQMFMINLETIAINFYTIFMSDICLD